MSLLQNSNNKYGQTPSAEQQHHNPSPNSQLIVNQTSQRARSTNSKPASAQASQVPSGQKNANQLNHAQNSTQSPWTPERS